MDTPAVVELIHQRTNAAANARVEVLGALTKGLAGEQLAEIGALGEAGCVAISNARRPIASTEVMRRALEYATTFGLTVFSHPEDPWLAREGGIHEGAVSARLGLPGIPETAETIALARDLLLAEQTGATIHFCRLSTRRAVQMVAEARARGLPVTADVAAHYLYLSQEDTADFDSHCHLRPPLRTQDDRNGLRAGLAEGAITAICSDHQPHELDAKLNPFPDTESGMSALETLVPLAIGLVDANVVGLNRVIGYLTAGPAGIIGQDRGHLSVGAPADICIIDPERRWTLEAQSMLSRGHNTPFLGRTLKGAVLLTLLGGRVVHEEP